MLSMEELKQLLEMEGEEAGGGTLDKFAAGTILKVTNTAGEVFILVVTNPISCRADVYYYRRKREPESTFLGNYHTRWEIKQAGIVHFDGLILQTGLIDKVAILKPA